MAARSSGVPSHGTSLLWMSGAVDSSESIPTVCTFASDHRGSQTPSQIGSVGTSARKSVWIANAAQQTLFPVSTSSYTLNNSCATPNCQSGRLCTDRSLAGIPNNTLSVLWSPQHCTGQRVLWQHHLQAFVRWHITRLHHLTRVPHDNTSPGNPFYATPKETLDAVWGVFNFQLNPGL